MELLEFLQGVYSLKRTRRTGWVVEGVREPESVADHSFGTALLALLLSSGRKDLDRGRAVRMALVHDLAECRTGDILVDWKIRRHRSLGRYIPAGNHGISRKEKFQLEQEAWQALASAPGAGEMRALWEELEAGRTAESRFVRSVDKLDMLLQAFLYEQAQGVDLAHWFKSPRNTRVPDPQVHSLFLKLLKLRRKTRSRGR